MSHFKMTTFLFSQQYLILESINPHLNYHEAQLSYCHEILMAGFFSQQGVERRIADSSKREVIFMEGRNADSNLK